MTSNVNAKHGVKVEVKALRQALTRIETALAGSDPVAAARATVQRARATSDSHRAARAHAAGK
jgi:hypothetical protein